MTEMTKTEQKRVQEIIDRREPQGPLETDEWCERCRFRTIHFRTGIDEKRWYCQPCWSRGIREPHPNPTDKRLRDYKKWCTDCVAEV